MYSLQTYETVCEQLKTSLSTGLMAQEVRQRQQEYGPNELAQGNKTSIWTLILQQFDDLLVRILLGAAFVSFLLAVFDGEDTGFGAFVEPLVILLILVANACVSISQETKAEKSLEALKKLQPEHCRVLRDGTWTTVESSELVPGDIIHVRVGDKVPADARICSINSTTLRVEESQLTGESVSVSKTVEPIAITSTTITTCAIPTPCSLASAASNGTASSTPQGLPPPFVDKSVVVPIIQQRRNMLFSSTAVVHGNCEAVVTAIGAATEVGAIHTAVEQAAEEEKQSPLQEKLDEFSQQLTIVIGLICVSVWLININHFKLPIHGSWIGGSIYYFKIAVALAVAAIPEGLPAVITTCLALGTKRMAKRNAIVRKLQSVETLGCTTVICSDKTGTLTDNMMAVTELIVPKDGSSFEEYVIENAATRRPASSKSASSSANSGSSSSSGLCPEGCVYRVQGPESLQEFRHIKSKDVALQYIMRVAAVCNDSNLIYNKTTNQYEKSGEPTEAALKVLVEKMGCPNDQINFANLQKSDRADAEAFCSYWARDVRKNITLEFTRERRSMSVHISSSVGGDMLLVKGAPESIIERCVAYMEPDGTILPFTQQFQSKFLKRTEVMAGTALRTLAIGIKMNAPLPKRDIEPCEFATVERDLIFLGIVGMMDPPRQGVQEAVQRCRRAGIRVLMVTGDNQFTAEAIAARCGIATDLSGQVVRGLSLTGSDYEKMSPEEQRRFLSYPEGAVLSRMEPRLKQQIVRRLREMGEVVAMTGDGVNDAPALRQADIGISMGLSGTEVAKEASAMVLSDDNFRTIVSAVEEGRSIYNNMKAFIRYLISSNIGEVASIFLTAALGIPEGFAPIQLLWVNLVTDGPPATALGFNPPDLDVMSKPPRKASDKLITSKVLIRYFAIGIYVGLATVGVFMYYFLLDGSNSDGHSLVTYHQLTNFNHCIEWNGFDAKSIYSMSGSNPCEMFTLGKLKASSLSLTVLVMIEMFNAFNAISEDFSLLQRPPWTNPSLCVAVISSVALHCLILYIRPLADIFGVTPLDMHDWLVVLAFSFPVILVDEVIKLASRGPSRFFYSAMYKLRVKTKL